MARRRFVPVPWHPIPLSDEWLADVWELQTFGGLQLTPARRVVIAA